MKRVLFLLSFSILMACSNSNVDTQELTFTSKDKEAQKNEVLKVLKAQENAWNEGNIPAFMEGYWQSKELTFIGSAGLKKGWQTTLENYQKSYPDKATMGQLSFDVLKIDHINPTACYLIGRFTLVREKDTPSGLFSLLWKKIDGNWLIVSDQTCG